MVPSKSFLALSSSDKLKFEKEFPGIDADCSPVLNTISIAAWHRTNDFSATLWPS